MTTDWMTIKTWWNSLTRLEDPAFVAVSTPKPDRSTGGEVHEDAAEEVHQLGLDPQRTSYAGWHRGAHRFRRGELRGVLVLDWAGDRAVVAERLSTVPDGFRVFGGEHDGRNFMLAKDRDLSQEPTSGPRAESLAAEISSLAEHCGPSELEWCHRLVADPDAPADERSYVMVMLHHHHGLTEQDARAFIREPEVFDDDFEMVSGMLAFFIIDGHRDVVAPLAEQWIRERPDEVDEALVVAMGGARAEELLARPEIQQKLEEYPPFATLRRAAELVEQN